MGRRGFSLFGVFASAALFACAPKSASEEDGEGPASGGRTASTGGAPGNGGSDTGGNATGGKAAGLGGGETGGQAGTSGAGGSDTGGSGAGLGGGGAAGLAGSAGCAPRQQQTCETTTVADPLARCPTQRAEATTCTGDDRDECGCADAGTCSSGELCLTIYYPPQPGFGGPGTSINECVADTCGSDGDCANGQRCLGGQYYPVCSSACRFDEECSAECGGRCVAPGIVEHGAVTRFDYSRATCRYPGSCSATSCAGCLGAGGAPSTGGPDHQCPAGR